MDQVIPKAPSYRMTQDSSLWEAVWCAMPQTLQPGCPGSNPNYDLPAERLI